MERHDTEDAIHLTKHARARIRRSPDQPTRWRFASNTQQTGIFICLPPPSRHFMYAMPPLLMPTPTYRSTCRTYHGRTSRSSTIPPRRIALLHPSHVSHAAPSLRRGAWLPPSGPLPSEESSEAPPPKRHSCARSAHEPAFCWLTAHLEPPSQPSPTAP